MSQIQYICLVIVVGSVTFISNWWPTESFPRSMWVKEFNLQITFMYIHFSHSANPPNRIVYTADIQKTLEVFYIYFFSQYFVKIKLKKLSILPCEFVSNFVTKDGNRMVGTSCSKQSLTLQSDSPGQHEHWTVGVVCNMLYSSGNFEFHLAQGNGNFQRNSQQ